MATENFDSPARPSYPYVKQSKEPDVGTPCPSYFRMARRWDLINDLMGGTLEMREERQKWLPQEPKESFSAYENRLSRTVLFGAYKRTVQTLAGLPFQRPALVKNEPEELKYLKEDCDGDNSDITEFSNSLLEDLLKYNITHVLVDMPPMDPNLSLEQQAQNKIRPYLSHISPCSLISWQSERVGGNEVLTQIRIKEETEVPVGEWGFAEVESVRVIYPDRHEIYIENDKEEYILYKVLPNELGRIPLVTIYGNRKGFMTAEPPLEDLAWLNLRHYQKLSDLDNIEHVANVPMLFGAGFGEGELDGIEIGPNRAITASNENASLEYVEHSGAAISASQKSIEKLEERMAAMGADIVVRKSVDRQTAAARLMDSSESVSMLQIMVNNLERGLEEAYKLAGEWLDVLVEEVVVSIGTYLDIPTGPNTIDIMTKYLIENQGMDIESAIQELQRRGVLSDTYEVNQEALIQMQDNTQTGVTPPNN